MKRFLIMTICFVVVLNITGCSALKGNPSADPPKNPRQALVDSSAVAVKIMRSNPYSRSLNYLLQNAKGVMIFPLIVKAGILLVAISIYKRDGI